MSNRNIAVNAFTISGSGSIAKQDISLGGGSTINHVDNNPKTCRVPQAFHDVLRNFKSLGQEFAYVVLGGGNEQRALIPVRDLRILEQSVG